MSHGRAVPWASWEEWQHVGMWLLSPHPAEVQRGLERVGAWRARGRVPLAVEVTAYLVDTNQRDARQCGQPEAALQLEYAMAIIRLVNGIVDSAQKGRVAASVVALAANAGLPRLLVDIRHEATHNELPALSLLRLAARHGLAWLQDAYWRRQADCVEAGLGRVATLVREFMDLHVAAASKAAADAAGSDGDASDDGGAGSGPQRRGARDGAAGAAGEGYQAAEGRRRRKALVAELRSCVPLAATSLLVDAVLATWAGPGGGTAAQRPAAAAEEAAVAKALAQLGAEWRALPPLLLAATAERLAAALQARLAGHGAAECGSGGSAAHWAAWVERLASSTGGAAWRPTPEQARALLGWALAAMTAQSGLDAAGGLRRGAADAERAAVLAALCSLLDLAGSPEAEALGGSTDPQAGPATAALCRRALRRLQAGAGAEPGAAVEAGGGVAELQGALDAAARATEQLACPPQPQGHQADSGAGRPRWQRCTSWRPAALGTLPCAFSSNGRLPRLDVPGAWAPPDDACQQQQQERLQRQVQQVGWQGPGAAEPGWLGQGGSPAGSEGSQARGGSLDQLQSVEFLL